MPIYEVELDDGRIVDIESDVEPDESSVTEALKSYSTQPTSEIRNPWDDPKVVDKMRRDEEMRRAVGQGMESGTELTTALAEGIGIKPEVREKLPEERVNPGLWVSNPEKAQLALEKFRIEDEGVPLGWRMGAAAHTGLRKGMQMPSTMIQAGVKLGRMLPGVDIATSMGRGIGGSVIEAAMGPEERARFEHDFDSWGKANDEYFQRVAKWEKWMSERDAMLGKPNFMAQLTEATSRGFAELPLNILPGMGASSTAQAMARAAIGAGMTSGLQTFGQELGEGASQGQALARGATAGLITGLTTKAFGATGIESIFRREGPKGIANRIKDVLVQAGYEGAEEAVDTFQADLASRIEKDPNRPIMDTVHDVIMSGAVGALLGGGMATVHGMGGERDAIQDRTTEAVHGRVRYRKGATEQQVPTEEGGAGVHAKAPVTATSTYNGKDYEKRGGIWYQAGTDNAVSPGDARSGAPLRERERARFVSEIEKQAKAVEQPVLKMPMQIEPDEEGDAAERAAIDESSALLDDAVKTEKAEGMFELGDLSQKKEDDDNQPFHGRLAIWDARRGKIVVDPIAWHMEMQSYPKEKRQQVARTIMNEEMTHAATTIKEARRFFALSSKVEQALARRIYAGKWGDKQFSETEIGYEMIRRRVQRINKMTITELMTESRKERMSVRSWQFLEDIIRNSRQQIVNRGGGRKQIAIIDNVLNKVSQVRQMAEAEAGGDGEEKGAAPAAISRRVQALVDKAAKDEKFTSNTEAIEAGLEAESIEDLEALRQAKKEALAEGKKARLAEAKANALGKADEAKAAADRKFQKGSLNQFLREAIEAATSTGSHRVEMRRFGETELPMPKLDWARNSEVEQWLKQHGEELGISLPEEAPSGPAAIRRAIPRDKASAIAKDLIEGGINTHHNVRLTAEAHDVSEDEVRRIKKILLKGGKDQILSYADAIENGWEDEALGLREPEGPAALSRAAEKRIAKLREKRMAEIAASERGELPIEEVNDKIIALSKKQREANLTELEQEELRELRRMRFEREKDMFGPAAISRSKRFKDDLSKFDQYVKAGDYYMASKQKNKMHQYLNSEIDEVEDELVEKYKPFAENGTLPPEGHELAKLSERWMDLMRQNSEVADLDYVLVNMEDWPSDDQQSFPAAIRRGKSVFEQMQEQKAKYKPGQKFSKDELEDFGVAVEKSAYDVDEKNDLRDKFNQRNDEANIMGEVREMIDSLSPAQQKFIDKHWKKDPQSVITAYNHYSDLKERGLHISDAEKRLLWALRNYRSDLLAYGAITGYNYDNDINTINQARIAHAFHEELMDLGAQDPRRPNELIHPRTIVENWQDYRVKAWKDDPALASLIDEKIYRKYQAPKQMTEEEWDNYQFEYDAAGDAIDPTEMHQVLSPDEEMADDLKAYYKEHGGPPQIRKPYKNHPTVTPTRDDGQEEFKLEGPAAIRRGGGSQRSQRLALLKRKLMEAKGEELPPELKTTGKLASGSAAEPVAPEERSLEGKTQPLPRMTHEDISAQAVDILSGEIKIKYRAKKAETLARDVERSNVREEAGTGRTGDFGVSAGRMVAEYPNFKEFSDWAKRNAGGIEPHQLRQIWEDAVWGEMLKASSERLDEWRKALGLEKKYGKSILHEEATAAKRQEFKKEAEAPDLTIQGRLRRQNDLRAVEASQRYRNKVIEAIAYRLVGESMDDRPSLNRKDVHIEDIDFGNANADFSPYHEFSADEVSNPDVLKKVLRDEARASNTDPESASRRLIVVVNKSTGNVEVLSTYNDNGVQRVVDPAGARLPKRPHRELTGGFLRQYRPIGSLLLKDPVRAFRRQYQSVSEFNAKLGTEAHERSTVGEGLQPADADFKAEGTPGIEGEGGYLIGKHKATSGIEISRPGSMESDTALSQPEVERMVDAIWDEVGQFDDASDVRMMVKALEERAAKGRISASDRVVISAFRKVHNLMQRKNPNIIGEIEKENPEWTGEKVRKAADEALMDEMAEQIFTISEVVQSRSELVRVMLSAFQGMEPMPYVQPPRSKFTRELTMPIERRAPTDVRAENLPPGVEPVVGQPKLPGKPLEPYKPEIPAEPERAPRTEGEKVAERAEQARHKEREAELNRAWDEAMNEPMRSDINRQLAAKVIRDTIRRRTGLLISWKKAQEFATNKLGTPQERVKAISEKIEESFSSDVRPPDPPTRPPGTIWKSGPRVAPHLRVKGPAAIRRGKADAKLWEIVSNAIHDVGSGYDSWMVDRIADYGGEKANEFAAEARRIIDREKQLYGGLTPLLDRARKLAGGVEPATQSVLDAPLKFAKEIPGRIKSSVDAQRAMAWLNRLNPITSHTAVARVVRAMEGTIGIPKYAENVVGAADVANREIGAVIEPVVVRPAKKKKHSPSGKFQRNLTSLGYDIIRQGGGVVWDRWTEGIAEANKHVKGVTLDGVQKYFRRMKRILDDPMTSSDMLERVNQDMARRYPRVVTHVKVLGRWQPVIHSDLFNYLENAARRATHVRAFREAFPATKEGKKAFKDFVKEVKKELTPEIVDDVDDVIRSMHGHPTDDYNVKLLTHARMNPQQMGGQLMRMANQTVNNVAGKLVLSGQMFVQPGEVLAGSTPVFLGYDNYLKAAARYKQLVKLLEINGARNPVMHDYTFNPTSPIRSSFKIAGNVISKATMQNALNELQEGLAAATARVVAENIQSGNLNEWEQKMLPQTFKMMGFTKDEVSKIMAGDQQLLDQFQRKAAAFLTGGNKAVAEGSSLGSNRLFNSIFRFQTYPMIKMNQAREVLTNWNDAMRTGSGEEKWAATRLAGRFFFGNAMQGALTVGLTSLAYGGMSGLKIRWEEAKESPLKFIMEMFMASISGPAYLLWRGMEHKGLAGYGEAAARLMFPYTMMKDVNDMMMGHGQYKDRGTWQKIGMFLKSKTPATKAIGTGLAMFGLSQKNQQLDEAIKGLSRWRRDKFGFKTTQDFTTEDEGEQFRMNIKLAIDAMKIGDEEAFQEAWLAAAGDEELQKDYEEDPDSPDVQSRLSRSFKSRKVLVKPSKEELSDEDREELRSRIGDEAYEALEYFDLMLDEAADGVMLPKLD